MYKSREESRSSLIYFCVSDTVNFQNASVLRAKQAY